MADMIIRNLPDEAHAALKEKAALNGKSLEAWLREQLVLLSALPTIRERYNLKAVGENGAFATLRRERKDEDVRSSSGNLSQPQFTAFKQAREYVRRNGPGDYEKAYALLAQHFDEVFPS